MHVVLSDQLSVNNTSHQSYTRAYVKSGGIHGRVHDGGYEFK